MGSGQITIIPKPELRGFWGDSLTKPPFGVTSAEVAIICPAWDVGIEMLDETISIWMIEVKSLNVFKKAFLYSVHVGETR